MPVTIYSLRMNPLRVSTSFALSRRARSRAVQTVRYAGPLRRPSSSFPTKLCKQTPTILSCLYSLNVRYARTTTDRSSFIREIIQKRLDFQAWPPEPPVVNSDITRTYNNQAKKNPSLFLYNLDYAIQ